MAYSDLPHNRIQAMRRDLEDAIHDYLRTTGWKATSATPGSYWMWQKTVTGLEFYKGDTAHNRDWLVPEDVALRLQSYWDGHEYSKNHPNEFED